MMFTKNLSFICLLCFITEKISGERGQVGDNMRGGGYGSLFSRKDHFAQNKISHDEALCTSIMGIFPWRREMQKISILREFYSSA